MLPHRAYDLFACWIQSLDLDRITIPWCQWVGPLQVFNYELLCLYKIASLHEYDIYVVPQAIMDREVHWYKAIEWVGDTQICVCRAMLCTTSMVQDCIVHYRPVLCTTDLRCAPWYTRGTYGAMWVCHSRRMPRLPIKVYASLTLDRL